jgi:nicotinamide-nucleotide amidase
MGIGESMLADRIKDFEKNLPANISLAYLPNYGLVRLRLTGSHENKTELDKILDEQFNDLRSQVTDVLVADEDTTLEAVLGKLLNEKKEVMATAESCTGGYIAHLLTANPKSSSFFTGSVVCYDKRIKTELLNVDKKLIDEKEP